MAVINPINMSEFILQNCIGLVVSVYFTELYFSKLEVPTYIHCPISEAKVIWRRKPYYLLRLCSAEFLKFC